MKTTSMSILVDDKTIRQYVPGKPGYGKRLTHEEWQHYRPILERLEAQGLSRQEIVNVATEEYGFEGTYAALNKRFKEWGLTESRVHGTECSSQFPQRPQQQQPTKDTDAHGSLPRPRHDISQDLPLLPLPASESSAESLVSHIGHRVDTEAGVAETPDGTGLLDCSDQDVAQTDTAMDGVNAATSLLGVVACEELDTSNPEVINDDTIPAVVDLDALAKEGDGPECGLNKRSWSDVCSIRSSRFSMSSDSQSFVRLAKRIRMMGSKASVLSIVSSLHMLRSSHSSLQFGVVTGYGSDIDTQQAHGTQLNSAPARTPVVLETVKEDDERNHKVRVSLISCDNCGHAKRKCRPLEKDMDGEHLLCFKCREIVEARMKMAHVPVVRIDTPNLHRSYLVEYQEFDVSRGRYVEGIYKVALPSGLCPFCSETSSSNEVLAY